MSVIVAVFVYSSVLYMGKEGSKKKKNLRWEVLGGLYGLGDTARYGDLPCFIKPWFCNLWTQKYFLNVIIKLQFHYFFVKSLQFN